MDEITKKSCEEIKEIAEWIVKNFFSPYTLNTKSEAVAIMTLSVIKNLKK